jgi:hypothetical protein
LNYLKNEEMKKWMIFLFVLAISATTFAQSLSTKTPVNKSGAAAKYLYKCPMHPEVITDKAGKCPKCGMDLVKRKVDKIYTCSMHPDVLSDKPGKCPKCGMDLIERKYKTK